MDSGNPLLQLPNADVPADAASAPTLPLAQASRRKLADTVTEQLLQAIRDLPPGTRLPSTQELTRRLGVGRSTVREALNGLATLGMVEIRHGMGVVVSAGASVGWGQDPVSLALAKGVTRDLLEARQIVEIANARLAAVRRTELDLRDIEASLGAHERCLDYPIKPASEFHVLIAEAAHNEVLVGVFRSFFKPMIARGPVLYERLNGFGQWELEQHRWIYEAVRDQNADEAAERMRQHVTAMESHYRKVGVV
jgi:GntR family transcriptional regulator, transcriptional repressor for pyruvate dehydrogenase complex